MFELFSAENRIIVSPQEELLLLTGARYALFLTLIVNVVCVCVVCTDGAYVMWNARNMQTLQEEDPAIFAERYGWRMPQLYAKASSSSSCMLGAA